MQELHRVDDLEIDQDLQFQRREWTLQRVGWVLMLLTILAGLAGVFGRGAVAHAVAGEPGDPLRLEYDRFVRRHADEQMTLVIAPNAVSDGRARVHFDSSLIGGIEVRRFTPEPDREEATPDGVVATFLLGDEPASHRIRVDYEPSGYWSARGAISIDRRAPLQVHLVIYP